MEKVRSEEDFHNLCTSFIIYLWCSNRGW
jgi:hypothetical protein